MTLIPHTPYFLVKLPRKKIDKIGRIFIPNTAKFMAFNLQCGEVVKIGTGAANHFPEVKIGHTLIFHHFVEADSEAEARVEHLVHQTNDYNYYVITAYEHNGKNVETYGVWDGERIIPNKDYIFLKPHVSIKKTINPNDIESAVANEQLIVTKSGLLMFSNWEESREEKEAKMASIKNEVEGLSKSGTHKHHVQKGIAEKEVEMNSISENINKKKYIPFKVAYYNNELLSHFGNRKPLKENEQIYILNIAASTELTFKDTTYIVAKSKYVVLIS